GRERGIARCGDCGETGTQEAASRWENRFAGQSMLLKFRNGRSRAEGESYERDGAMANPSSPTTKILLVVETQSARPTPPHAGAAGGRNESICFLSGRCGSSVAFSGGTYPWLSPNRSEMGSRHTPCFDAVHSL